MRTRLIVCLLLLLAPITALADVTLAWDYNFSCPAPVNCSPTDFFVYKSTVVPPVWIQVCHVPGNVLTCTDTSPGSGKGQPAMWKAVAFDSISGLTSMDSNIVSLRVSVGQTMSWGF